MVEAMERVTGVPFEERAIKAIIYEAASFSGSGDKPMQLRASYPAEVKKATLIHELLHRMLGRVRTTTEIDEHRKLFLVLYDIWVSLYGKEFADRNVAVESLRKGLYDYETAWKWALAMSPEERAAKFKALRAQRLRMST
jgi:predicted metal-dependent peptidase